MKELHIPPTENNGIVDITDGVASAVAASGVKEGICVVFAPHATAAILVLELDGMVEKDVLGSLSTIVPKNGKYAHNHGTPGHGASHVKAALLGPSKSIPVKGGRLQLGTWQSIAQVASATAHSRAGGSTCAFCELDGPRSDRKVLVQVVGR